MSKRGSVAAKTVDAATVEYQRKEADLTAQIAALTNEVLRLSDAGREKEDTITSLRLELTNLRAQTVGKHEEEARKAQEMSDLKIKVREAQTEAAREKGIAEELQIELDDQKESIYEMEKERNRYKLLLHERQKVVNTIQTAMDTMREQTEGFRAESRKAKMRMDENQGELRRVTHARELALSKAVISSFLVHQITIDLKRYMHFVKLLACSAWKNRYLQRKSTGMLFDMLHDMTGALGTAEDELSPQVWKDQRGMDDFEQKKFDDKLRKVFDATFLVTSQLKQLVDLVFAVAEKSQRMTVLCRYWKGVAETFFASTLAQSTSKTKAKLNELFFSGKELCANSVRLQEIFMDEENESVIISALQAEKLILEQKVQEKETQIAKLERREQQCVKTHIERPPPKKPFPRQEYSKFFKSYLLVPPSPPVAGQPRGPGAGNAHTAEMDVGSHCGSVRSKTSGSEEVKTSSVSAAPLSSAPADSLYQLLQPQPSHGLRRGHAVYVPPHQPPAAYPHLGSVNRSSVVPLSSSSSSSSSPSSSSHPPSHPSFPASLLQYEPKPSPVLPLITRKKTRRPTPADGDNVPSAGTDTDTATDRDSDTDMDADMVMDTAAAAATDSGAPLKGPRERRTETGSNSDGKGNGDSDDGGVNENPMSSSTKNSTGIAGTAGVSLPQYEAPEESPISSPPPQSTSDTQAEGSGDSGGGIRDPGATLRSFSVPPAPRNDIGVRSVEFDISANAVPSPQPPTGFPLLLSGTVRSPHIHTHMDVHGATEGHALALMMTIPQQQRATTSLGQRKKGRREPPPRSLTRLGMENVFVSSNTSTSSSSLVSWGSASSSSRSSQFRGAKITPLPFRNAESLKMIVEHRCSPRLYNNPPATNADGTSIAHPWEITRNRLKMSWSIARETAERQ